MKRFAVFLFFVFLVINLPAQEKREGKVLPKSDTTGRAKQVPPPVDMEKYRARFVPIKATSLAKNRKYLAKESNRKRIKGEIVFEAGEITARTSVAIAENADAIAILNPVDPYTLKLSLYKHNGQKQWEQRIRFADGNCDLVNGLADVAISKDGKAIIVSGIAYDERFIVGIYYETGAPVAQNLWRVHCAPSGNYLYGNGSISHDCVNLSIIETRIMAPLLLETEFFPPPPDHECVYTYRILDGDILLLRVTEARECEIVKRMLYVYDLGKRSIICRYDLEINSVVLEPELSFAEFHDNTLCCTLLDPINRQASILHVNTATGESRTIPINEYRFKTLSTDGNHLLTFTGRKSEKHATIMELQTQRQVFDGKLGINPSFQSFVVNDTVFKAIRALEKDDYHRSTLFTFTFDGRLQEQVEGWFSLSNKSELLPNTDTMHPEKISITILQ